MFDFDLRSGYHHVDIFEEHMTYLGLSWTADGITETYCFCVLPFGLTSAGYIFTKICRVPVKCWRGNGIQIVLYLDDGIGTAHFVRDSLEEAGFAIHENKSHRTPSYTTTWLGLAIDTVAYTIEIKQTRIAKILQQLASLASRQSCSPREMAAVAGGIISVHVVLGSITRLFTRYMYGFISAFHRWDRKQRIPTEVLRRRWHSGGSTSNHSTDDNFDNLRVQFQLRFRLVPTHQARLVAPT